MYRQWQAEQYPVDKEYLITNLEIIDGRVYFDDYINKKHSLKLKVDKLGRCYITYKNKQIYFIISTETIFSITPAYRDGDKIVSLGFNKYDYNTDSIHFYRI